MGTRNLTCVYYEGNYKVAQYGKWDGYPDGQGKKVLDFLKKADLEVFKEQVKKLCWMTEKERKKINKRCFPNGEMYMGSLEHEVWKRDYFFLSGDTGADILWMIYEDKVPFLKNEINFAGDSLFCEWAYVVDFDKNVLEVYFGFNKKELDKSERFYNIKPVKEYKQIRLLHSFSLDDLPEEEEFVKTLDELYDGIVGD